MSRCPIDYSLCRDTVTVYRLQRDCVLRQVVERCLFQWEEQTVTDASGSRMGRSFLLIVPGTVQNVFPGDRVYEGIGPEITLQEWPQFIPACVQGLGQVSYVKPCRWDGQLRHVEAGNRRTVQPQL